MSSTVTKNVFESIAAAVYDMDFDAALPGDTVFSDRESGVLRRTVALDMAEALTPTNERFDPIRFVRSCGVPSSFISDQGIAAHSSVLRIRINAISRGR